MGTRRHHLRTKLPDQVLIMAADVLTNTAEAEVKAARMAERTTTLATGEIIKFTKQELHPFPLLVAGCSLSLKRHKNLCAIPQPLVLAEIADQAKL